MGRLRDINPKRNFGIMLVLFSEITHRRHRRTSVIERIEVPKGKPGFIPMKNDIRFNGQDFRHNPFNIVEQPIEGRVGHRDLFDPMQISLVPQVV